jgi:hypothetical protein
VTFLVQTKNADKIFKLITQKADLSEPQSGLVYQMPLHKRAS